MNAFQAFVDWAIDFITDNRDGGRERFRQSRHWEFRSLRSNFIATYSCNTIHTVWEYD